MTFEPIVGRTHGSNSRREWPTWQRPSWTRAPLAARRSSPARQMYSRGKSKIIPLYVIQRLSLSAFHFSASTRACLNLARARVRSVLTYRGRAVDLYNDSTSDSNEDTYLWFCLGDGRTFALSAHSGSGGGGGGGAQQELPIKKGHLHLRRVFSSSCCH